MSGKPTSGPKPLAPLKLKIKVTLAKAGPAPVSTTDAALTVLPDPSLPKAEDQSKSVTGARYEGLQARSGMFSRGTAAAGLPPPGKRVVEPAQRREVNVARPLFGGPNEDENEDEEEANVRRVAEEEAPKPPPARVVVPPPPKPSVPVKTALPSVAKQFMGLNVKAPKKSYKEDAVKRRFTEEVAKTLVDLNTQLEEMALTLSLEEKRGYTAESELVDGKTKYVFEDGQRFIEPLTEERLAILDDLFESLRLRGNYFLVKDTLLDKEIILLYKYLSYAPKYIKDKPKIQEKQRILALKDMLTDRIAATLMQLEESLTDMETAGIGIPDMKVTVPTEEGKPYIYEFEDGNTFLPVDKTPESRRDAEARLEELSPFFSGGSKLTLSKLI